MKKLFFSILAITAFSSYAEPETLKEDVLVEVDCQRTFNSTYVYARNQGYTDQEAGRIAFVAYDKCMGCESTICSD